MRERTSGQGRSYVPTLSAERIAQALKWAAPDSLAARVGGIKRHQAKPILQYQQPEGSAISIAADYLHPQRPLSPSYGLKVNGEERVYTDPADIEALLSQHGRREHRGKTEAQRVEALVLYETISSAEAHRQLPRRNARHIEEAIFSAQLSHVQTIDQHEGEMRIYFPFVEQPAKPLRAKMIEVITSTVQENADGGGVARARDLVKIPAVLRVLESIPDHAVTVQEKSYGGVTYIQITDAKGRRRLVDKNLSQEVKVEWTTFNGKYNGAEFAKITGQDGKEHIVHELLSEELTGEILSGKKIMVVFGASGSNAKNFSVGWKQHSQELLIAGEGTKMDKMTANGVHKELQFNRDSASDHQRLDKLLESGLVFAVYDSTDVKNRIPNLERVVSHLQSGKVERYFTTKPVARTLDDLKQMKRILRKLDHTGRPIEERFFIHEHFIAKAQLRAFLAHAEEVVAALGTPVKLEISIQEKRTAEHDKGDEDRVPSLPDGLMQDLAPHAASISTLMQQIISSMGYEVSLRGRPIGDTPMLTKLRYAPTEFGTYLYKDPVTSETKEVRIDTGFVVEGQTTIKDRENPDRENPDGQETPQHDLHFIWMGGKGLVDDKRVTLTFRDESTVVIDLNGNTERPVVAPDSLQHLFRDLEGKPQDNGYGGITAGALLGDHPEGTFQNFYDASVVWIMEHRLKELSNGTDPYEYQLEGRPSIGVLAQRAREEAKRARRGRAPAAA